MVASTSFFPSLCLLRTPLFAQVFRVAIEEIEGSIAWHTKKDSLLSFLEATITAFLMRCCSAEFQSR